jgi:hypothetical protein
VLSLLFMHLLKPLKLLPGYTLIVAAVKTIASHVEKVALHRSNQINHDGRSTGTRAIRGREQGINSLGRRPVKLNLGQPVL